MATEVAELIFKSDTSQLDKSETSLENVERQAKRTETATKRLGSQTVKTNSSFGVAKGGAANLSMQLQDVATQMQSGTNASIILAQQGPQIASVFGPAGAAFGAILAFGSLVAGPFINSLFAGNSAIDQTLKRLLDLEEGYNSLSEAQRRVLANEIESQILAAEQSISKLQDTVIENNGAVRNWDGSLDSVNDQMGVTINQTEEMRNEQDKATAAIEDQQDKIAGLNEKLAILRGEKKETTKADIEAKRELDSFNESIEYQIATLGKSRSEVLLYKASLMDLNTEQAMRVQVLADMLAAQEAETQAVRDRATAERELTAAVNAEKAKRAAEDKRINDIVREMEAAENELKREGLLDVETSEIDAFSRREQRIKEFYAKGKISAEQYNEAINNLETQRKDFAIKTAGDALNQLGQVNETAFKVAKAYNIGQAVMNTYTGATKALAELPPPLNFIVAAATVAQGLAQVQQIRSQSYQGRALGGQVRAGESYVVGERGPEVLTMGSTGRIIPNEKVGGGGQQVVNRTANITFEISTVDARGFDQLLQSRRGQIINMVNTAMNDQGRRGVA